MIDVVKVLGRFAPAIGLIMGLGFAEVSAKTLHLKPVAHGGAENGVAEFYFSVRTCFGGKRTPIQEVAMQFQSPVRVLRAEMFAHDDMGSHWKAELALFDGVSGARISQWVDVKRKGSNLIIQARPNAPKSREIDLKTQHKHNGPSEEACVRDVRVIAQYE